MLYANICVYTLEDVLKLWNTGLKDLERLWKTLKESSDSPEDSETFSD